MRLIQCHFHFHFQPLQELLILLELGGYSWAAPVCWSESLLSLLVNFVQDLAKNLFLVLNLCLQIEALHTPF